MQPIQKALCYAWILSLIPLALQATALEPHLGMLQKKLGIPESIAKISDGQLPPDHPFPEIILIQDIHRHPEVQGHIAALLLYGVHQWGLQDVFLEGAQTQMTVSRPAASNISSLREALQEGRIGGAEMAVALEPDAPLHLYGLEDPTLYRQNVAAYEEVERLRPAALRELETAQFLETSLDIGSPLNVTSWDLLRKMLELHAKPMEVAAYRDLLFKGHEGSALDQALRAAEHFYDLADQRSESFIQNSRVDFTAGPHVLVVGGYHTAMMAQKLREEGRSFVVLTPAVTQSGYDDLYARGMQQTISALKLR